MLQDKAHQLLTGADTLLPLLVSNAISIVGAIVILLLGIWLAGRAHGLVARMLGRTRHFDAMLKGFFGSIARYFVLTVTVLAVLAQFGIQTTSLVAVIGAAGLAVGLALQGTLSNLAAGIMLLICRPFRVDHKVQIGSNTGTVRELSLFWTELMTDDKVQVIVPNAGVWGQPLRNFSAYAAPHAGEVRFRIAETTELDPALDGVREIVGRHPRVLADPAPTVLLDREPMDNALEIVVGFATAEDEVAAVKSDLIKSAHEVLSTACQEAQAWQARRRAS